MCTSVIFVLVILRYPGCWWWTQLTVSLLSKPWPIPSSGSTSGRMWGSSAPERRLGWAAVLAQHCYCRWFKLSVEKGNNFHMLPCIQVLIVSVLACIRMYSHYRRVRPLTREVLARDPYSIRGVRKLIDGCAFRIYGHWVKKGEQQNRAALFQNTAKIMLLELEEFET